MSDELIVYMNSRNPINENGTFDAMDAFAYIVEMLEVGYRYFEPADEVYDDPDEIEKEYDILK